MNRIIPSLIFLFTINCLFAEVNTEEVSIFFESGKSDLSSHSKSILDSLVKKIPSNADFEIYLAGHTDGDGSSSFNEKLSEKRAQVVGDYLILKGLDQDAFTLRYFGESKPIEPNTSSDNKKLNRRVQIKISRFVLNTITDLENALKSPTSKFQIDASKEQELIALQGSKLRIPANSFLDEEGNPIKDVEIRVVEALDFNDFIGNNLATISGDQLLVTGGMLKIEAFSKEGERLSLNSGQSIGIEVPNDQVEKGMLLFSSENGQNWETDGEEVATPNSKTADLYKNQPYKHLPFFREPIFQRDLASKPQKPLKPRLQREPKMPDDRILHQPIKWYLYWNKSNIEKNREKIYSQRMEKYSKNMELYRERKKVYQEDLLQFLWDEKVYNKEFIAWEENQIKDSLNFKNTDIYIEAELEYASRVEAENIRYARVYEKWKYNLDSILELQENLSSEELNRYVSRTSQMSWVNIDRFLKLEARETRPITVKETDEDEKKVIVVFEDLKTIIPLSKAMDKDFKISRIPKKYKAKVLAYKVKDGKAYVYYQNITHKDVYQPVYKPLKIRELRKLLTSLNT